MEELLLKMYIKCPVVLKISQVRVQFRINKHKLSFDRLKKNCTSPSAGAVCSLREIFNLSTYIILHFDILHCLGFTDVLSQSACRNFCMYNISAKIGPVDRLLNFAIVLIMEQEMEIWSCNQSIEKRKARQFSVASPSCPAKKNILAHN